MLASRWGGVEEFIETVILHRILFATDNLAWDWFSREQNEDGKQQSYSLIQQNS